MPGPEDFARFERDGDSLLLVSAAARREGQSAAQNGIYLLDPSSGAEQRLPLHGRDSCTFSPHGIDSVEVEPGRWQLWVVVHHQPEACEGAAHSVEHYRVEADGLHFVERLSDPLLTNPNELDVLPDGRLWLSNNPTWEQGKGLVGDLLFRRAKGKVLHYNPTDPARGWSVAASDFVFPNGIAVLGDQLWVSAAYGELFRLTLDASGQARDRVRTRLRPRATLDNFTVAEDALWVTGHPKGFAFIRHSRDAEKDAPTVAYRIELSEGPDQFSGQAVASWREGQANAGSTVMPVGDELFVALVFDDGLRRCGRPQ